MIDKRLWFAPFIGKASFINWILIEWVSSSFFYWMVLVVLCCASVTNDLLGSSSCAHVEVMMWWFALIIWISYCHSGWDLGGGQKISKITLAAEKQKTMMMKAHLPFLFTFHPCFWKWRFHTFVNCVERLIDLLHPSNYSMLLLTPCFSHPLNTWPRFIITTKQTAFLSCMNEPLRTWWQKWHSDKCWCFLSSVWGQSN